MSPLKNPEYFTNLFFNNKIIPSNKTKMINHKGIKSPLIYLKTSKSIYPKAIYNISKNKNRKTINNNSYREKNKKKYKEVK